MGAARKLRVFLLVTVLAASLVELRAQESFRQVMSAIVSGDAAAVKRLVPATLRPDFMHPRDGTTPLIWAALAGEKQIAEYLLSLGAPVDSHDRQGLTALMHAALRGEPELIDLLADRGADVLLKDSRGRTAREFAQATFVELDKQSASSPFALQRAVRLASSIIKLEQLEKAGPSRPRPKGSTAERAGAMTGPLREATPNESVAIERFLRSTEQQRTVPSLHTAAAAGNLKTVQDLIAAGANVNARDGSTATPLMRAALGGHVAVIRVLLGAKADVNARSVGGVTALISAAGRGETEIVNLLLANGADVNAMDRGGITPLFAALDNRRSETALAILRERVDLGVRSTDAGGTALHLAATNGLSAVVEQLLAKGLDVNAVTHEGGTALHLAARGGHLSTCQILIAKGANVNARVGGLSALSFATRNGHAKVAELLTKSGAK